MLITAKCGDCIGKSARAFSNFKKALSYGTGEETIPFGNGKGAKTARPFEGLVPQMERLYRETESDWAREEIARYFTDIPCAACKGYRLKPEALCVRVGGRHIGEVAEMSGFAAAEVLYEGAAVKGRR